MRTFRIKVPPQEGVAVYHCISRTVNGERLLDDAAREMFRRQMWQVADYCGVQILTYAVLSNHFHILVLVPQATVVSDVELLRRYKVLYPKPTKYQVAKLEALEQWLAADGEHGQDWRRQQLALMGDVSQFMKLLKQRFSVWFNRTHRRFGTLWSERFKSVLVENGAALRTMAAYIDLNPVRAGLVKDPKDYRFCGYAEAVAGNKRLRLGLSSVFELAEWRTAHDYYRQLLYGAGGRSKGNAGSLSAAQVGEVMNKRGTLTVTELLRCRVRYFTDGAVLGCKAFVAEQLEHYRQRTGRRRRNNPRLLPNAWGNLAVLRGFRQVSAGLTVSVS